MGHRGRRYWDRDQIEAIRQAHDYMLANLGQPLTIEGLARAVSYFRNLFEGRISADVWAVYPEISSDASDG